MSHEPTSTDPPIILCFTQTAGSMDAGSTTRVCVFKRSGFFLFHFSPRFFFLGEKNGQLSALVETCLYFIHNRIFYVFFWNRLICRTTGFLENEFEDFTISLGACKSVRRLVEGETNEKEKYSMGIDRAFKESWKITIDR